eukprot:GFKZ01002618.1.p1 GENE.GFKZ01002618.1~~GFKZ01002618.1.p1  ORF type:complete len:707 (+),score=40.55 GFKZ01002618.1:352-2472(+)
MQSWHAGVISSVEEASHQQPGLTHNPFFDKNTCLRLLHSLETHRNVILHGQIGYELTTSIPRVLVQAGWAAHGQGIAVALPRQVTALKSAVRAARENGLSNSHIGGDLIGYAIHSEAKRSSFTKVVFYSNYALQQAILSEPLLSSASIVVILDFQERGITVDLLLGLLKGIQKIRRELRVVLTTNAFDAEDVRSFLGREHSVILQLPSSLHPVHVMYAAAPVEDYHEGCLQAVRECFSAWLRRDRPQHSNVLVYVKGAQEAEELSEKVNNWFSEEVSIPAKRPRAQTQQSSTPLRVKGKAGLLVASPLHANLSLRDQLSAIRCSPFERRLRVIIATSIAETSLSVEGITTVIDCGFERTRVYNPSARASVVSTVPISRSSANWRASRAGLVAPGTCIRLYTREFLKSDMADCRPPEILRCDLTDLVLALKAIGFTDIMSFPYLTRPNEDLVASALSRLYFLGAMTRCARLTSPVGLRMSASRLSPQLMKSLIIGESYGVGRHIVAVAAMLQVRDVVFQMGRDRCATRNPFAVVEGDLVTLLNLWRRYVDSGCSRSWCADRGINANAMQKAKRSFVELVKSQDSFASASTSSNVGRKALGLSTEERVCRSIAGGFCENLCMVQPDGSYLLALSGRRMRVHRGSVLRGRMPRWVVYTDLSQHGEVSEIEQVTVVRPEWIVDSAPALFERTGASGGDVALSCQEVKTDS